MTTTDHPASEREWLVPSAVMTAGLGLAALLLMPVAGFDEIPPYLPSLIHWVLSFLCGGVLIVCFYLARLMLRRVESPTRELIRNVTEHGRAYAMIVVGILLAGVDMIFFMWIKPEVTAVAPFRADELYADLDHLIFGRDPWRFFEGIDLTFHAWAYSFFWAVAIIGTLLWLFAQPPSRARSTALLNYFVLWSLFGPIAQLLGSAAGPIFYERIGLGDRFAAMGNNIPAITNRLADYLWNLHSTGELGVAAGISAMPSLHIATVAWVALSFGSLKSKLTPITILFALYIWALSVALGWHYAVDGVVGALGAMGCHAACGRYLAGRSGEPMRAVRAVPAA
jgi:hypothetical protein